MNRKKIGVLVTIIVAVGLGIFFLNSNNKNSEGNYDSFASCLTGKGVKMYGTEWCSHCKNQKKMFGDSFQNVDYIDCDRNREECLNAGVRGYPTWVIDGNNYPGEQSLQRLSDLSGCDLNV